jgi:hypothetical protein
MSVKSGKFQIVGTEKKVNQRPSFESPSSDPKSGMFQMVGTTQPMSRKSVHSPSSNPRSGQYQIIGDETKMSRKPVEGYGSAYDLEMSRPSLRENDNSSQRGGRKK